MARVTLGMLTSIMTTCLKNNAPVRQYPQGAIRHSPYPGNLKNNGIVEEIHGSRSRVVVGGARAPYAIYTESTSKRAGWIAKSQQEFLIKCQQLGGRIL